MVVPRSLFTVPVVVATMIRVTAWWRGNSYLGNDDQRPNATPTCRMELKQRVHTEVNLNRHNLKYNSPTDIVQSRQTRDTIFQQATVSKWTTTTCSTNRNTNQTRARQRPCATSCGTQTFLLFRAGAGGYFPSCGIRKTTTAPGRLGLLTVRVAVAIMITITKTNAYLGNDDQRSTQYPNIQNKTETKGFILESTRRDIHSLMQLTDWHNAQQNARRATKLFSKQL